MSDAVSDTDNKMRENFGLNVEPPPEQNTRESAHDLVKKDLIDTGLHYTAARASDELLYAKIASTYAQLCIRVGLSPLAQMEKRKNFGLEKYGTILQAFNGRRQILDCIDELADALVYMRMMIEEAREVDQ